MANKRAIADHRRTNSVGGFWLDKRRDGRSDVWMVAWYDADGRTIRYRTTRTRDVQEAKRFLRTFANDNPALPYRRQVEQREAGKVYFIAGDVGGIKIGAATDPVSRLITLQCGSPIPLRLLAVVDGGRKLEREYHRRFAAHRLHGEWFTRCPEIEAEIARLNGLES